MTWEFHLLWWFGLFIQSFLWQGITVTCLGQHLWTKHWEFKRKNRGLQGFSAIFQKKVSKINKLPWLLGTSEDFRWSTTEGTRPDLVTRLLQKYFHRVMLLTPKSKIAAKSFFEIMHMIRSPLFVFHPLILFHVLLETLKRTNQQSKWWCWIKTHPFETKYNPIPFIFVHLV